MIKFIIKSVIRDFSQYLLATMGLIIGITSLIAMGYLGIVGKIKLYKEINKQGVNIVYVYPESIRKNFIRRNFTGSFHSLKDKEIEYVSSLPFRVDKTVAVKILSGNVKYSRNSVSNVEIIGSDKDYINFFNYKTLLENRQLNGCYIGYTIFKELFGKNQNTLGKYINIKGKFVKIKGILDEKGASSSGRDLDNVVVIPLKLFKNKFSNQDYYDALYVKPENVNLVRDLKNSVKYILKKINLNLVFPLKEFQFSVRGMDYYIEKQAKIGAMMVYSTFIVSSITLLVGGIGVMAIMLILSIKETREIGIKRALGATKFYIFIEYIVKSLSIAVIGSALGLICGIVSYFAINKIYGIISLFPVGYAVVGVVSVFAISLLFGIYPAFKASRIEPSAALRHQ